jgi:hypothetical protein
MLISKSSAKVQKKIRLCNFLCSKRDKIPTFWDCPDAQKTVPLHNKKQGWKAHRRKPSIKDDEKASNTLYFFDYVRCMRACR